MTHSSRQPPIVVVGAGLGGLSAAIHLAAAGREVVILERNPYVGGKMAEWRQGGYRWDLGPSLITMPFVFEELFAVAGRQRSDYLTFHPVEPATRCFFPDGTVLDLNRDLPRLVAQLATLGAGEVEGYLKFLAYAARLYRITAPLFLFEEPPHWGSLRKASLSDLLGFDGWRTMAQAIRSYVRSPYLRQILEMFATYVGASPYRAPAAYNVIAHVELNQGVWYPQGGVYRIAEALSRLATELGVDLRLGQAVEAIEVQGGAVSAVRLENGERLPASAVVANLDPLTVYERLLPLLPAVVRRLASWRKAEPSLSALVVLLGVRGEHPTLTHHNEFFSSDYPKEFHEIFSLGIPPSEPTIYLSVTSKATPGDAPPGCENWFLQINVPALSPRWDWSQQGEAYIERLLERLAHFGYDVRNQLEVCRVLTPQDWESLTGARRGALYGFAANHRLAAFRRPHNRSAEVRGLYFAGGTVHPGGGVPLVILSGKIASRLLLHDGY